MEWIWYILASLGAGVGTGLAGLSAAILMWGMGDAAAALVGIPFGKHKAAFPPVNGKKSWEGTGAMLIASFLAGFFLLHFSSGYPSAMILPGVWVGAIVGAGTELLSPSDWDTVTVPVAILIVLLLLV
ncbi:MAG: hypothetical protein IJ662_12735 [Clostridia bacterium]|nr:hypothetical protein [Clostridia bacterium]